MISQAKLVAELADAAETPDALPGALRSLAETFRADHVFAHFVGSGEVSSFTSRGSEETLQAAVSEQWNERNPRLLRGLKWARAGGARVLTEWRLFSPHEIARDEFEQDFAAKHQCEFYAGEFLPLSGDAMLVLDIERGNRFASFWGSELDQVDHLLGELGAVLRGRAQLRDRITREMVDALGEGSVPHAWLGSAGDIRHLSPAFADLLGRFFGMRRNRLRPLVGDAASFDRFIDAASSAKPISSRFMLMNPADPADVALARAFPKSAQSRKPRIERDVMLSVEPILDRAGIRQKLLKERFHLSPSEIRLAALLGEGKTLRQAAELQGVTYETARARLKAVFQKMAIRRQSDLVRMLGSF